MDKCDAEMAIGGGLALAGTLNQVGRALLDATVAGALTTPTSVLDLGVGAETAETAGATFVGEGLGYTIGYVKLGYDALSFAGAYLACGP
jgi:hypothetical protein